MDVQNDSRARDAALPMKDKLGRDLLVVIAKYTFAVDAHGRADSEGWLRRFENRIF